MKIVINALGPSKIKAGIGNYLFNLISELSRIDPTNKYIIFASSENIEYYTNSNPNFKLINIGFWAGKRFLRILWEQFVLPIKLLELNADILFSPGFVCPLIKVTRYVTVIHDMTFFSHPQVHTFFKRLYFPFMIRQSVKRSEKIIAVSNNTSREIQKYIQIPERKLSVTHLAASTLSEENSTSNNLSKKYGIDSEFMLFVGMLEPRKNLKLIIKALPEIIDKNLKLVIVGKKGWMIDNLFDDIKAGNLENRVIFTGFVPDEELLEFYKTAQMFVYPSLYEGFGIPVLEAMSAGCPVITSNVSSLPEVAGDAAIMINPDDSTELARAINLLNSDENYRNQMIGKGFENIKKFNWEKTAIETLSIFDNLTMDSE